MSFSKLFVCLLVAGASACATGSAVRLAPDSTHHLALVDRAAQEQPRSTGEEAHALYFSGPVISSLSFEREAANTMIPSRQTSVKSHDLAIWSNPSFRRDFVESYKAETDIEPRITIDERETMEKFLELRGEGETKRAIELLVKRRKKSPSALFDFALANMDYEQQRWVPAVKNYKQAIDKFPKFRRAWKNLGLIYAHEGDYKKAAKCLAKVISLGGADAATYGLLGYSYYNLENYLSAESAYRMAILFDPETIDWQRYLAHSLFKQSRHNDTVALCNSLIARYPGKTDLWLLQAFAFSALEKPLKAAENFELVDGLGDSTAESLTNLGNIYVHEGLYDLAVNSYARVLEKFPDSDIGPILHAAKVLTSRSALEQMDQLVARLKSTRGDVLSAEQQKELLKLEARSAVARGQGGEQLRVLEEVVALDPLDGEALIEIGKYYGKNGEPERAVFYFDRAANIDCYEASAKLAQGQMLVREGSYSEALPLLRRAQELEPRPALEEFLDQVVERLAKGRK